MRRSVRHGFAAAAVREGGFKPRGIHVQARGRLIWRQGPPAPAGGAEGLDTYVLTPDPVTTRP